MTKCQATNGINPIPVATSQYAAVTHWRYKCDAGKAKCKAALQKELGFEVDPKIPLLGWIGRLDFQKGPDVVLQSVEPMAQRGCQVSVIHHASCFAAFPLLCQNYSVASHQFSNPKEEKCKSCCNSNPYNLSNNFINLIVW